MDLDRRLGVGLRLTAACGQTHIRWSRGSGASFRSSRVRRCAIGITRPAPTSFGFNGNLASRSRATRPGGPASGARGTGPFIRARNGEPKLVVGIWALIGDSDTKPINRPRMTNCARWEELAQNKTYKDPWARSQRCLIPAERFDYPN